VSTLAYGALTRKRVQATPKQSGKTEAPGLKTYVDIFAALVPAEVLGAHAAIISLTTKTVKTSAGKNVTTITHHDLLKGAFVTLIVFSAILYILGRAQQTKKWRRLDFVRMLIPPAAFVGWMMAQRTTAMDAFWTNLDARSVIAILLALPLAGLAGLLSVQADRAPRDH
jgi:hypothetical protein